MEDQTNNRIREECSVDYNLSPQITEVADKIIACVQDKNIYYHSNRVEAVSKFIDELLKSQREEMIEKIEKMIKIVNYQLGGFFIEEESYNEAIKDILYLIKNNG